MEEADAREFIITPNGSKKFGEISKDIEGKTNGAVKAAEIRLQVGFDRQGKGYGFIHINKHLPEIQNLGYKSVEEYISDIASNFTKIYISNYNSKRMILVRTTSKLNSMPIDLELADNGENYYTVVSDYPRRLNKEKNIKGTLVYDGSAPTPASPSGSHLTNGENTLNTGSVSQYADGNKPNVPSVTSSVAQDNENVKDTILPKGVTVEVNYNEEKKGVELKFNKSPGKEVTSKLSASGYRWSKQQHWWAKQSNANAMELAKQLVGTEEKPIDKHPDVVHGYPRGMMGVIMLL